MRKNRPSDCARAVGIALFVMFALGLAGQAAARNFPMSGTWEDRRGQVFIPLGFPLSVVPGFTPPAGIHTNTVGLNLPNGPHKGQGQVTATGASPATLSVPTKRFDHGGPAGDGKFAALVPLKGITIVQITTMFTGDGPAAPGVLKAGYGKAATWTWCPQVATYGACTDPVGTMVSTDPPQGPGAGRRNGRIIYKPGPNKFGGVMQILLAGGGLNTALFKATPFRVAHFPFGGPPGGSAMAQHIGGMYSTMNMVLLKPGYVTEPDVVPTPDAPITDPGPFVTTAGGLTTTAAGPKLKIGIGPSTGQATTNTGHPFTTGMVYAQQTTGTGGGDIFTLGGSDMRTGQGAGNITLVAGGLGLRKTPNAPAGTAYIGWNRLRMTLGIPVPSMSPAGIAAGCGLMLLAVGYATRRRLFE